MRARTHRGVGLLKSTTTSIPAGRALLGRGDPVRDLELPQNLSQPVPRGERLARLVPFLDARREHLVACARAADDARQKTPRPSPRQVLRQDDVAHVRPRG